MPSLRFALLVVVFLGLAGSVVAQQEAQRDPRAVAIAAQAFASVGGPIAAGNYSDFELRGTTTFAGISDAPMPITVKGRGTQHFRVEVILPKGLNVFMVRDGEGAILHPDGSVQRLEPYNTLAPANSFIPAFSFLALCNRNDVEIRQRTDAIVLDRPAAVVELNLAEHSSGPPEIVRAVTRRRFFIDKMNGLVLKLEYDTLAENDSTVRVPSEILYFDYREFGGVWIPLRQSTYVDGQLQSEVMLHSVQFNVGLSDSTFALPR